MLHIPLSGIKKIEEIAGGSSEYVSLSQGSIKVGGIPQQVKSYIQTLLNSDITDYYQSCWGIKALREKLADHLQTINPTITPRQILPTHGCIGGLSLLYLSLLQPGDEVIIPEPSYPAYAILAQTARATTVHVSCLKSTHPIAWELDVEKIKAATTAKTKMIIFSNPWNPIGMIVPHQTIEELIAWCDARGIYLVLDEAYRNYDFEGTLVPGLTYINKSEFVISANSFSKNMAMSGWRIGYLVVPEKLIGSLAGVQDALLNCLNNTAQYAALFALEHPELEQEFHHTIKASRDYAMELIQPLVNANIVEYCKPDGGFFLFLKTEYEDTTDLCMSILHKAKVGIIPGPTFGPTGSSFMRICYARDKEVLHEGIKRLNSYFL